MRKKRIIINSDFVLLRTGLAKNARWLAEYLYNTGKYDILYYACGMAWESPEYQRLPFACHGAMPNNPMEVQAIQAQGEKAVRDCAYGLTNVDKVIEEFKPDVFIVSNDSWAYEGMMGKPWWNKVKIIPHTTLDSLPFLDNQIECFKKCEKVYVWAEFAEKEARRLGYNNVELLPPIIRNDHLFKLRRDQKLDIRKRNNIPSDAFIAIMCSRNQLRKEFKVLINGYSIWRKENPSIKNTFLLLHTNFSEPGGWQLHKFAEELGVNKNEILTTYHCRKCKEYEIKPFQGNDLNCRFCTAVKSQINITIQEGASEEQLNEIYNAADCMVHLCNAGGAELTPIEGLTCELPLICNGYSSMDTYVEQDFVFEVRNTFTTQHGTQFKRAVPNPADVAKHLGKIYSLSIPEREKIGKVGREWAISKFDADKVCKQWESIIDSFPNTDYEYKNTYIPKNPNAILENLSNNEEWVTQLYNKILLCEPDQSGFYYWIQELNKGVPRQTIEHQFRGIAAEDNKKNTKYEDVLKAQLDGKKDKKVLVVLKESIGDIICSTAILESINKMYSDYDIYFATLPQHFEILKYNSNIYKCIPFHPQMLSEIWATGQGNNKGFFDVYINLGVTTQHFLNYLTNDKALTPIF